MKEDAVRLYENEEFQRSAGHALRPGGLDLTKKALAISGLAAGSRILDIGCGCGKTVDYLGGGPGMRALGVDISPEMPARARKLHGAQEVMVGDAGRLPYADCSMDGILCECVYNLLEDRPRALAQMDRVLKPGGRLMVSDLYLREKTGEFPGLPLATCINGIAAREAVVGEIGEAGFALVEWRDETPVYLEFVAGLIMAYGSMSVFWESLVGSCEKARAIQVSLKNVRIGYYLSVWEKRPGRRACADGGDRR
jgi:arsenite methyltransferase